MSLYALPYIPIRQSVYSAVELFSQIDPGDADSFAETTDFKICRHFITCGGASPADPYVAMTRALHDNGMTQLRNQVIQGRRVAAIMGGHKMRRDSVDYRNVCTMARHLAREGLLVATGGGPGAMEAAHIGALLSQANAPELNQALLDLATAPELPEMRKIVSSDGSVDFDLVRQAHAWFLPAWKIATAGRGVRSLAVPTWHYGFEPTSPFATDISKYFQNSVREDGLLEIAQAGIIFTPGKAGTIQEIFQDGAQNYYRSFGGFSPMVFFGRQYWTEAFPVIPVLEKLFSGEDFARCVRVTDDPSEAARFIVEFPVPSGLE